MRRIILTTLITLLTVTTLLAAPIRVATRTILGDVTATATSSAHQIASSKKSFQLVGATATGAGTAAVQLQVSNDNSNYITIDTLSLTLSASSSSDYYSMDVPWKYTRGVLNSITGTGATVSLISAEESRF